MKEPIGELIQWSMVDGIALIEVMCRELNQPKIAQELAEQLRVLMAAKPSDRYILDFRNTEYMSSTAFTVVVIFGREVTESGGRLAVCEMRPEVRIGADILSLGRIVPLYNDLAAAIASLTFPGP